MRYPCGKFIRTTPTRNSTTSETYITHRLVENRRVGGKVRQVTLLLEVDLAALPLSRLSRASDLLVKHRDAIESRLLARIETVFGLETSVTLYDLTNPYFEGVAAAKAKAARGRSKEKRSDCPRVTLGVVCDGNGVIRRSRVFAGNAVECRTLEQMLTGLGALAGAMVIMDRGLATAANLAWLKEHGYRYLVVSREPARYFDADRATTLLSAGDSRSLFVASA